MNNFRMNKITFKNIIIVTFTPLYLLIAYFIIALVLSLIPVNRHFQQDMDIPVYLLSNGVHVDIVVPITNDIKDWTLDFHLDSNKAKQVNFISFGWGDKNFYINTPEWSDLTLGTAIKAVFLRSESAMHVDFYRQPIENDNCKLLWISNQQYKHIVHFIENSFTYTPEGNNIKIGNFGYFPHDAFYEAKGSYHLFFTCNTWTNRCLSKAGLKACLWTPFDKGILYQYR